MDSGSVALSLSNPSPAPTRPIAARTRMILEAPVFPTLMRLAAPNVLNLLALAGMITFDGLFVGKLGADALAGVSLAFPWVMLVQHTAAGGMGGAVSSAVARALGSGQRDRPDALASHTFALAVILAAIFSGLMIPGAPLVFQWMGGRGEVLAAALAYANVAFAGAISIFLLNLLGNVVRGTGNMGLPAAVIVGAVLAHLALSPALIFGWGPLPALGPAGAGWGLALTFGVGSLVLVGYLRSSRSLVALVFRGVRVQPELFREILCVGVPGMINNGITNLSVVVLTGIAGHLGRETAIGYAMGARLEYILIPLAAGIGFAIVAMVGTNWGAKQFVRARRIAWTAGATSAVACGTVGIFFALFPRLWMGLFTEDAEVVRIGVSYLRIVGPIYALYGLGMALYFATQGLGRVGLAVLANGLRLLGSAGGALLALYWFGAGATSFFIAVAAGFALYGALTAAALVFTSKSEA
ncbi:MAG: MATE family efflux transporter [Burkholderiales bacterium]